MIKREGIGKFAKARLLDINITYNGEKFSFNLFEEVRINQALIDKELKNQPSYYGFLVLLQKKLLTQFEDLKLERKKVMGKLFLKAKGMSQDSGRPFNDEMAKVWVESHKDYIEASKACIKAKDDADTIYACVKSFEQRKDLMQTLASNQRAERRL